MKHNKKISIFLSITFVLFVLSNIGLTPIFAQNINNINNADHYKDNEVPLEDWWLPNNNKLYVNDSKTKYKKSVKTSMSYWNKAMGKKIIKIKNSGRADIYIHDISNPTISDFGLTFNNHYMILNQSTIKYGHVNPDVIVTHEMGHALGLDHVESNNVDIMNKNAHYSQMPKLTYFDKSTLKDSMKRFLRSDSTTKPNFYIVKANVLYSEIENIQTLPGVRDYMQSILEQNNMHINLDTFLSKTKHKIDSRNLKEKDFVILQYMIANVYAHQTVINTPMVYIIKAQSKKELNKDFKNFLPNAYKKDALNIVNLLK